jgi:thioredoxin 1
MTVTAVTAVTDDTFVADVLGASEPVLVDVWAAWCAPCKALDPVLERLATAYAGRVHIRKLDADANLETVTRFDVRALPTLLLFDRGTLVERIAGAQAQSTLSARLDQQLARRASGLLPQPVIATAARAVDATAEAEAQALLDAPEPLVVFKHSPTCAISVSVKREYDAFVAANPSVPTRLVIVQRDRPLSNALEAVARVQHESPQAMVVKDGRVLWHASHRRITATALADALRMAAPVAAGNR